MSYLGGWPYKIFPCSGHIEANHGFDRADKGTRWVVLNGFSGCHALNTWAHYNKRKWYDWCRLQWGFGVYEELKRLANSTTITDYDAVLAQLGAQKKPAV